ncbi:sugar ABC transporter substrate-binding protein [Breznakiellaceae bacterium SP9]
MKSAKRVFGVFVLVIVTGAILLGCNKKADAQITVGLGLTGIQTNSVFIDVRRAIEAKCKAEGYKLITADFLEGPGKVTTFMENCLNADAKVVLFQNIAEDSYADLLQQLKDKGTILGSYDNPSKIAHYIGQVSNYELGKVIGQECGKWVAANPGSKKVAICGYPTLDFLAVREQGMRDGFAEVCPEGQIVISVEAGYVQQGVEAGENFLQSHPDLQAVMGINDSGPFGVAEAYKAAGKSFAKDHIGLFGCDASEDAIRAIKENDMFLCTIDLDVVNQATELFERCLTMYKTGEFDASKAVVYFPPRPIYLSNIALIDKSGN